MKAMGKIALWPSAKRDKSIKSTDKLSPDAPDITGVGEEAIL